MKFVLYVIAVAAVTSLVVVITLVVIAGRSCKILSHRILTSHVRAAAERNT